MLPQRFTCSNILPTKANVHQRKVQIDPISVKSVANMLNLLLIFCRNVHLQEMCGHYDEAKYRNSQMMLRSFSSSSAAYWTSSHAWNLNGGLWSVGQYVMLGTYFTLKRFKTILNLFWLGLLVSWGDIRDL